MQEKINEIQEKLAQKKEEAILDFIKLNGFISVDELKNKGYDIHIKLIERYNMGENLKDLNTYTFGEKVELELVKIINSKKIDLKFNLKVI